MKNERVKRLQNIKSFTIFSVSIMFMGVFVLSPAISSLTHSFTIRSTGEIQPTANVTARSGSARDVQAAVDWVVASGGIGSVYIPEGTFNFVEVGESWTGARVNIPAGVNLFGAPTERDANGQVIEWKTVLAMPWEVPTTGPDDMPVWFSVQGDGSPDVSFRFSDIKLVGWRFYDTNSITMYIGLRIYEVQNFRVDHCNFQDIAGSAIRAGSGPIYPNRKVISGVIDHCRLVNSIGLPAPYASRTLDYGINLRRWACDVWDYDITNVFGKYNNYTIFIEDNYFSKWRHDVASNDGIHYVFRHNLVEGDYGYGSVDAHGSYAVVGMLGVGTRAVEIYENVFKDPITLPDMSPPWAIHLRGGSAVVFNNIVQGYNDFLALSNDVGNRELCPQCFTSDTYIWNNDIGAAHFWQYLELGLIEGDHYFLRVPNLAEDGFEYMPYPYPHPLTLQE